MDGPKKLAFTTVGPVESEPKKVPVLTTNRFNLDLTDTTDSTCPEFFYSELLKNIPGANGKVKENTLTAKSDDPFGDDDDPEKMAAIAKAFEDKYNKPAEGKKKKKKWKDNYYLEQLGDGYDENDTFIDNSEAYDEVLPETMTTKLGGFYINSGKLDLRELSDSSEDEFRSPMIKMKKKRRISSSDDSDSERIVKKKKVKDILSVDGEIKKKKKKKLIVPPGEQPLKKIKLAKDKVKPPKPSPSGSQVKSTSPNTNGTMVLNGVISDSDDSSDSPPHMKSNVSAVIDSVIAASGAKEDSNSRDVEEPKKVVDPESVPKLPPALPTGMEERILQLKNNARESRDGKLKFFTDKVNKLLLEVEMISKEMKVSDRSAIFGHLAAFLPCSKDTLLKRAKSLRAKELEDKIKEPLQRLKQAVGRAMPVMMEKFEEECKKAAAEKQDESTKDESKKEEEKVNKDDAASDDDEEKMDQSDPVKKRQTGPRKKFVWDSELRSALCDVVRVKMHTCQFSKTKQQTAEDFCKAFLDQDVRPLWPKGWMQTRVLYKESKSAHMAWTNPQKPKKSVIITKMQQASSAPKTLPNVHLIKTPTSTVTSTPVSVTTTRMPVVTVTKTSTPMSAASKPTGTITVNVSKTTPVNAGGSKPVIHTPVGSQSVKKPPTPTAHDYAIPGLGEFAKKSDIHSHTVRLLQQGTAPSPDVIKIDSSSPKGSSSGLSPKSSEQSWDHIVSDILRSSIGVSKDTASVKSVSTTPQLQRQNSNPISSTAAAANSFLAQFANFAHAPITKLQASTVPSTTAQAPSETAVNLSTQKKVLTQQQLMENERKRQIVKLFTEQQKAEKQKTHQQQVSRAPAPQPRTTWSQSSPNLQQSDSVKQAKSSNNSPVNLTSPTSSTHRPSETSKASKPANQGSVVISQQSSGGSSAQRQTAGISSAQRQSVSISFSSQSSSNSQRQQSAVSLTSQSPSNTSRQASAISPSSHNAGSSNQRQGAINLTSQSPGSIQRQGSIGLSSHSPSSSQRLSLDTKQSKPPAQSPMSLAMSKNIPAAASHQGAIKMNPKQLVNQFQSQPNKNMTFSEAYIRQQLSDSSSKSSSQQQASNVRSITKGTTGQPQVISLSDRSKSNAHVSSSTDTLRKTSPQAQQSQPIRITQTSKASPHSANTGQPSHASHAQNLQQAAARSHAQPQSPTVTVTTNGRPATKLLETLFGHAQAHPNSQTFPGINLPPSPTQKTSPQAAAAHKQWSPGSTVTSSQASGFQGQSKAYPVTVNPQAAPSYQRVKVTNLSPNSKAAYQAALHKQLRQEAGQAGYDTHASDGST